MMNPGKLTFIFLFFCSTLASAQNSIGLPHITNYSTLDYKGGTQNWDIQQDKSGILYFANNEGLLTFNGCYWKIYPLPNKTIVRSVRLTPDGRIYVGGQDEMGYFFPDERGVLKFTSLKNLIPASARQFSDVWNIVAKGSDVFFRTMDKLFRLKDEKIEVLRAASEWEYAGLVDGEFFAQDLRQGLMVYKNGRLDLLCDDARLKGEVISGILPYRGDTLLITTLKNGLFLLAGSQLTRKESSADALFRDARIFRAIQIDKEHYALGTTSSAVMIMDRRGEIVQHFSSADGLQKDNIRSLFLDRDRNLWVGLDNGIGYIAYSSAIKTIYSDRSKQVTSYSTIIYNQELYIGTSNGVFVSPVNLKNKDLSYSPGRFREVENTSGQVWNLAEVNKSLLLGHEDGAFVINGTKAKQIYKYPGTWLFQPVSAVYPSHDIIAGTYNGLYRLGFDKAGFVNKGPLGAVTEPLRFLTYDTENNTAWASHPYRGIFRFVLSADKSRVIKSALYTQKDGLPFSLYNYVFFVRNRIVVSTARGIYEYNPSDNRFIRSPFFNDILKNTTIEYLKEDTEGNVWFVSNKKIGVIDFLKKSSKKPFSVIYFPELTARIVAGFVSIYPYNKNNIFIGANQGVFHINYEKYAKKLDKPRVMIGQVRLTGETDSIIFGGYFVENGSIKTTQSKDVLPSLPHRFNSLHFEYASSLFEHRDNTEYSFQLLGFDRNWSEWNAKSEKDYTNLPPGTYTFRVKARNNLGSESAVVNYTFKIRPAWYQTYWTYSVYMLLLVAMVYLIITRQRRKHENEQKHLKYQHQLELERNEKKIVSLQNEKLEAEVVYKNKELATTTMHLVQRGKLLSKIRAELMPLINEDQGEYSANVKRVLRLLDDSDKADSDWHHFSIHFDHVHSNYLSILKEKFPQLSSNDLKLCAYLKMNLTTKEMAQLMNITIRAVEVSRYRLRKKINVPTDVNLFDFLMLVTGQSYADRKNHDDN